MSPSETDPITPPEEDRYVGLKEVMTMAWPIMLGAMSFVLMDFVDKLFVSKLGVEHLAAVGSAGIWSYTLSILVLGVAACVSTFASQSLGRGNKEDVSRYTWQGIYISAAAGLLALGIWPVSGTLFQWMGHADDVTALELEYFNVRLFGFIFVSWQAAQSAFFMSIGRPKIPMYVALVANITNIGLDYVLIFGKFGFPQMGISGAALATVVSIGLQAVLLQIIFMSDTYNRDYNTRSTWQFDLTKITELLKIGWPAGLSGFLDVASWAVFTSIIVGRFGTAQLAAHTAAINFMHLSFVPVIAINHAIAPIVGQWIGKSDIATAKARAYTAMRVGMVLMFSIGATMAIFGKTLMRVFSDDPEVIALGHVLLICAATFALFDAVNIVLSGALRGAGDTRWMMIAMFIGSWCGSLPLAYLFAVVLGMQAKGAWIGATIYIILLSGVFLHRFHGEKWRHINIFSDSVDDKETSEVVAPADVVSPTETNAL
ncbi:MAG: MATE family efflux transporter [Candidatus Hydrogenedentota bacterium]